MFEAKLVDGSILKRIVEAIKDVVNDVNIDVSPSGKSKTIYETLVLSKSLKSRIPLTNAMTGKVC